MRDVPRPREAILAGLPCLAEGLYFASVQWLYGQSPGGTRYRHEVRDPPTNGWGTVLLLDREADERGKAVKMVTLFTMSWFDSFQVSRASLEYQGLVHPAAFNLRRGIGPSASELEDRYRASFKESLPLKWAEIMKYGWTQKDFDTAAIILRKLDLPVPLIERAEGEADRVSGGKEVSEAGLTKPVKRDSRKGQVLAFFWPETKSIRECMAEMGISRSNVLSQLYLLQKDHGIGYELKNDAAIITMPAGVTSPWLEAVEAAADAALA